MKTYYSEMFAEFETLKTKEERKAFLKKYGTAHLQQLLTIAFNPRIKTYLNQVPPKYRPSVLKFGMEDFTIDQVLNKFYLFEPGHPRDSGIPNSKREQLLVQYLEGMPAAEAKVLLDAMLKALDVKYLTAGLVREVWPHLVPIVLDAPSKKEPAPPERTEGP
jgi:hypothetical protein